MMLKLLLLVYLSFGWTQRLRKERGNRVIKLLDAGHRSCATIVLARKTNGPRNLYWCRPSSPLIRSASAAVSYGFPGGFGGFIARGKRLTFPESKEKEVIIVDAVRGIGIGLQDDDDN